MQPFNNVTLIGEIPYVKIIANRYRVDVGPLAVVLLMFHLHSVVAGRKCGLRRWRRFRTVEAVIVTTSGFRPVATVDVVIVVGRRGSVTGCTRSSVVDRVVPLAHHFRRDP